MAASVTFASAPVVTAAALSVGTDYETLDVNGDLTSQSGLTAAYLANKRYVTFARSARAVMQADGAEHEWTNVNTAVLTGANCGENGTNGSAAGEARWRHGTTQTAWEGATATGAMRYTTVNIMGGTFWIVARIRPEDASQNYQYMGVGVWRDSPTTAAEWVGVGRSGGNGRVGHYSNAWAEANVTVNTAMWVMLRVQGTQAVSYYSTSSSTTPPTSESSTASSGWKRLADTNADFWADGPDVGQVYRVGMIMQNNNAGGASFDASILYLDWGVSPMPPFLRNFKSIGGQGYPTTASEINLMGSGGYWDMGAGRVDETKLRYVLQDVVNRRRGDAATWTFSCVQSSSTSISSGTFAAAGSVTVEGSGRYVALFAKCASSGNTQPGSLMLPFTIPIKGSS